MKATYENVKAGDRLRLGTRGPEYVVIGKVAHNGFKAVVLQNWSNGCLSAEGAGTFSLNDWHYKVPTYKVEVRVPEVGERYLLTEHDDTAVISGSSLGRVRPVIVEEL